MKRDRYECVVTGRKGHNHPQASEDLETLPLTAAHILHRAVAVLDRDPDSDSVGFFLNATAKPLQYKSAQVTYGILRHFAHLDLHTINSPQTLIDEPSNGITLEPLAHSGFDKFYWCLQKTDVSTTWCFLSL